MDSLILFVLTVVLGVVLSWLLDRHDGKEVGGGVSASTAVEDFFVRIQKAFRLNAPGGVEGGNSWTKRRAACTVSESVLTRCPSRRWIRHPRNGAENRSAAFFHLPRALRHSD